MTEHNPFASGAAFIDGEYKPVGEAGISVLDWGFIRSDVTFDVVSVWQGSFFRLADHLSRFEKSCQGLRMNPGLSREGIAEVLDELVRLSGLRDAYVEFGCTRGLPTAGSRDPRTCQNRFYAHAIPYIWIANEQQRENGLHMIISSVVRIPPESVNPTYKNYHRGDFTQGLFEAFDRGADTVVLQDGQGNITEGPGFNVFTVRNGAVHTPETRVLEGITRKTVLELCEEAGISCQTRVVSATEAREAEEVFISTTAGGIIGVTTLDGNPVGSGEIGGITRRLSDLYWSKKAENWHGTKVDYSSKQV